MKSDIKRFVHRFSHLIGCFEGLRYSWQEKDDIIGHKGRRVMIGFKCDACGNISNVREAHPILYKDLYEKHNVKPIVG